MSTQTLSRWLGMVGGGLTVLATSCYSASLDESAATPVASKSEEIIGGFGANNSALNAVGTLNITDPWGYSQYLCTATLVSETMAVTARQCAEQLPYTIGNGGRAWFSIGPNAQSPLRQVEVVYYELAPASPVGYPPYDVAVLHLDESITDITPLAFAAPDASAIGQKFVGIGYGAQSAVNYSFGIRRLGSLTLRATSGRVNELAFGSFAAYFKWYLGTDLPSECDLDGDSDAGVPAPDGGVGGRGGSGGGGTGGFPGGNYLCEQAYWLRQSYDNDRLESAARVYAGGLAGEAQPCDGDGGSPLLRKNAAGQLVVYGVLSSGHYATGPTPSCAYGAVYTSFDKTVLAFLDRAKEWVDPCGGLNFAGRCSGSVAERCSGFGEGERRELSFDCDSVNLSCEVQNDGTVGCGPDDTWFRPEPTPFPGLAPDVNSQIFRSPTQP